MLRPLVIAFYQAAVHTSPVDADLKRALKTKERVPAFIDNLCREIEKLPPHIATRDHIQTLTTDMTHLFLRTLKAKADQDRMSIAAKRALQDVADQAKKQNELSDRINKGESIDLSEVIDG